MNEDTESRKTARMVVRHNLASSLLTTLFSIVVYLAIGAGVHVVHGGDPSVVDLRAFAVICAWPFALVYFWVNWILIVTAACAILAVVSVTLLWKDPSAQKIWGHHR